MDDQQQKAQQAEREPTPEHLSFKWLASHPVYLIPIVSLLAYLIAANYLDGYLRFYSARAHWFEPGIFRLVAFASTPLTVSAILACLFWLLYAKADMPFRYWLALYGLWVVAIGGIIGLSVCASIVFNYVRSHVVVNHILLFSMYVLLPWAPHFLSYRWYLRDKRVGIARSKLDELEGDAPETEKKRRELRGEITTIDELFERKPPLWLPRYARLISYGGLVLTYIGLSGWMGTGVAFLHMSARPQTRLFTDAVPTQVVFTDGKLALVRKKVGEDMVAFLQTADGSLVAELSTPSEQVGHIRKEISRLQDEFEVAHEEWLKCYNDRPDEMSEGELAELADELKRHKEKMKRIEAETTRLFEEIDQIRGPVFAW